MDHLKLTYYIRKNRVWQEISCTRIPKSSLDTISETINWDNPNRIYIIHLKETNIIVTYKIEIDDIIVDCCRDVDHDSGHMGSDSN